MTKVAKFNIGDKVIVTKNLHVRDSTRNKELYPQVGEVVTVKEVSGHCLEMGEIYWFIEKPNGRYEVELELEAIYNTPLWKALQ